MKRNLVSTLAVMGSLFQCAIAFADRWYVNGDNTTPGSGDSWSTAFDSIDAVTLDPGDELWIAGGTALDYVITSPLVVPNGAQVYGGFSPFGEPAFGDRNPGLYPTIIDASGVNVGIEVGNGAGTTTWIEGLTVQGAEVFGIQNGNTSLARFNGLTLRNNGLNPLASASGAFQNGIDYAFPIITNCLFEDNFGIAGGGAFRCGQNSSFRIEGCVFRNNSAMGGGAIQTSSAEQPFGCSPDPCDTQEIPVVRFSIFEHNTTPEDINGGAIHLNGDIKILACAFTANEAGEHGGAIYSVSGRIILQDTSFVQNTCDQDGGAIYVVRGCELSAHSCLLARNTAVRHGGAIRATELNELTLQNCTITENDAEQWAGVYARVDVDACGPTRPFEAAIENSILWQNGCLGDIGDCTDDLEQLDVEVGTGGTLVVDYNDISAPVATFPSGFGAHNLDINFDPQFIDPANFNWRLQVTSPCIDAANGEVIPQDGEDADGDSRTTCDGCDEEDNGEHLPDLDLGRRIIEVRPLTYTGNPPLDDCPLECGKVPDMGCYERIACMDSADCATPGDLNGDTVLNGLDIQPFAWCAVFQSQAELPCLCGDFSGPGGFPDSVVDVNDIPCFIELLLTGASGCTGPIICNEELFALTDCNANNIPDANDIAYGTSLDCNANGVPDECDIASETSNDANANDIPDECETDCNNNGIPDDWDISEETSNDINSNDIPDECETDCNGNDVPDDHDIATSASDDCNENGVPDECEEDCNGNDVPDDCDIADSTSEDCNENGIPDECDLSRSMLASFDCNGNDIPDECDIASSTSEDCNENGIPDECDIANSISADENENDIPDECEEESFMFGGGNSMMGGEGGEFDADAAWATFYDWLDEQVFGTPGDWHTLTGPQRFERVMDELRILGLPLAAPW